VRKLKAVLCCVLPLLLLGACRDGVELENRGFVISIGVDKTEDDLFAVSLSLPNAAAIAGKDGGEGGQILKKAESGALPGAMQLADAYTGQTMYYGHTKIAVFGRECLRDAGMMRQAFDALERNGELSKKLLILAADGTAADILNAESAEEPLIGTFVADFYKNNANKLRVTVQTDLEAALGALRATGGAVIPHIGVEDGQVKLSGAAVLVDYALAGWLDETQTRGWLWFHGAGNASQVVVEYEGLHVPFDVQTCASQLAFEARDGRLVCRVSIDVKGGIEAFTVEDGTLGSETQAALECLVGGTIAEEVCAVFELLRDEYQTDVFDLRESLHKWNAPLYRAYSADWPGAFREMEIEAQVDVTALRTGVVK